MGLENSLVIFWRPLPVGSNVGVIVLRRTQLNVAGIHKPRVAVRFAWRAGLGHGDAWLVVGRFVRGLLPAIGYRGENSGDEGS